jgi:hypothetical protein
LLQVLCGEATTAQLAAKHGIYQTMVGNRYPGVPLQLGDGGSEKA